MTLILTVCKKRSWANTHNVTHRHVSETALKIQSTTFLNFVNVINFNTEFKKNVKCRPIYFKHENKV